MAVITTRLIAAAADLWSGATADEFGDNPEYLRGQVELIVNTATEWNDHADDREGLHDAVTDLIGAVVATAKIFDNAAAWEQMNTPTLRFVPDDDGGYEVQPVHPTARHAA